MTTHVHMYVRKCIEIPWIIMQISHYRSLNAVHCRKMTALDIETPTKQPTNWPNDQMSVPPSDWITQHTFVHIHIIIMTWVKVNFSFSLMRECDYSWSIKKYAVILLLLPPHPSHPVCAFTKYCCVVVIWLYTSYEEDCYYFHKSATETKCEIIIYNNSCYNGQRIYYSISFRGKM